MGKSAKKSTKVVTAAAVTPVPVKGKRGAEVVVEKVSVKKQKKNDGTVQAIEKLKSETKTQKKIVKKVESSSSDDESSDSEEEQKVKAVKPSTKKPTTNGLAKKDKSISSDSSDDSDSETDTKPKSKVIAPPTKKVESSSEDDSSDSDDDTPQPIQGKKVAPKADTSSDDSSSDEEDDKKTTVVNKSSAAAKKKVESSSDEEDDDSSSEDEKPKAVAKAPITGSKSVPVASKKSESSDSSDDDSDSDEEKAPVAPKKKEDSSDGTSESESEDETPAKKPTSANGKISKLSAQVAKKESSSEESSEDDDSEDEDEDEDEKPSKGQKKKDTDVEMVDAVTPKPEKKTSQTPVTPQAQSEGSKTLFVGNLPFSVEESDVINFFKDAGKVLEVRFSSDRDGQFKGYGHVEFETAEAAQKALKFNGKALMDRELRLDIAKERGAYTPGERTPFQKTASVQGSTMFVGGIDRNSAEDDVRTVLQEHFAACGEITRVGIPTDRESGGIKGIAYVDFTDSESLKKALELGGPEFGGYTLNVDEAKPRDNSGPGGRCPSRGGRFGGGRRDNSGGGRFDRSGGSGGRSFGRSGGGGGRSGGRRGGFNRPNLAAPGTGKKTTFD